jgi:hypothetical protein
MRFQLDFFQNRVHTLPRLRKRMFSSAHHPRAANFSGRCRCVLLTQRKQSAPPPPQMEDPIDHGEYSEPPQYEGGGFDYGQMEPQEEQPSPGYKNYRRGENRILSTKLGRLEKNVDSTSIKRLKCVFAYR